MIPPSVMPYLVTHLHVVFRVIRGATHRLKDGRLFIACGNHFVHSRKSKFFNSWCSFLLNTISELEDH